MLDRSGRPNKLPQGDLRASFSSLEKVHRIMKDLPERDVFWKVFTDCVKNNPSVVSSVLLLMAVFLHLRPYSQQIIRTIDERLTGLGVNDLVPSVAAE
jgi:hypothetical protein